MLAHPGTGRKGSVLQMAFLKIPQQRYIVLTKGYQQLLSSFRKHEKRIFN